MEEKYVFDEVTEPFEWPADVPTMEESTKWINEQLKKNGSFYPTDPFRVLKPTTEKKVYLIEVEADESEYYEDSGSYDFTFKVFSSKESAESYLEKDAEELFKDISFYLINKQCSYHESIDMCDFSAVKVSEKKRYETGWHFTVEGDTLNAVGNYNDSYFLSIKEMEVLD